MHVLSPRRTIIPKEHSRSRPGTGYNVIIDNSYLQYANELN